MFTISHTDDDDFDDDEFPETIPVVESINMVLVGMQALHMTDPQELQELVNNIWYACEGHSDRQTFVSQLQSRVIALQTAHNARSDNGYLS